MMKFRKKNEKERLESIHFQTLITPSLEAETIYD